MADDTITPEEREKMEKQIKDFHPFTIKPDSEKRKEKIERLKSQISMADILGLADDILDGDDEDAIIAKVKAKILAETAAMEEALAAQGKKADKYKDREKGGKIADVEKFFAADDDYEERVNPIIKQLTAECAPINEQLDPIRREIEERELKEEALRTDEEKRKLADLKNQERVLAQQKEDKLKELNVHTKAEKDLAEKEEKAFQWARSLEVLKKTPPKVLKNLYSFHKECEARGKTKEFNDVYNAFTAERDGPFAPYENANGDIANEHRFGFTKDDQPMHSILNLKDTGLNISWVGDKLGLLHSPENLTPEQLKAFAEYCFDNGVEIEKVGKLETLKVVDKDGNLQGTFMNELNKEMARLNQQEENQGESDQITAVNDENGYKGSFYDFLEPPKELKPNRAEMVAATKKRIGMMGFNPELARVTRGWNTTVISVYASENDRMSDNEVDKNGKRSDTKQFSVELTHTIPPKGRIYVPPGRKVSADLARTTLDAFKAAKCQYFIIPGADKLGKEFAGKFIEAAVKTGMVPYLASSQNSRGCHIGAKDLATIINELPKEEGLTAKEKVQFQMRLSVQLDKYMGWNKGAADKLSTWAAKIKHGALFGMFTNTHLDSLQDYVEKGMKGELGDRQWDSVDQVTATAAMNKIIQDISKGTLNGKPYNPIGENNDELLKKAMDAYMALERPLVEKEINDNLIRLENSGEKDMTGKMKNLVSTALRARNDALGKTVNTMKAYGVEMQPKIVSAQKDYEHHRDKDAQTHDHKGQNRNNDERAKKKKSDEDYRRWLERGPRSFS